MTFNLAIPDEIVAVARRVAADNAQPVEDVLFTWLKNSLPLPALPTDEEAELEALKHLSTDALWTIAREQMPAEAQDIMTALMDKHSLGTISPSELEELTILVERGQRLMLRKSEAAALLTRRGQQVSPEDLRARE